MGLVPETKVRILEALTEEPAHGYLLAERLDLSHGYIYTHLKELRDEDMVEIVEEDGDRKIYGLTESGEYLLIALTDREPDSV
jgi:DNA-binding PadR family transcriptional regulator